MPNIHRAFFGASALLFVASAALTISWGGSMSAMDGMAMPGGWTMSMVVDAYAGTDVARRRGIVRRHVDRDDGGDDVAVPGADAVAISPAAIDGTGETRVDLTDRCSWARATSSCGRSPERRLFRSALRSPLMAMQRPALASSVPAAVGVIVLLAGVLQFTGGRQRHLARCRGMPEHGDHLPADAGTAWRYGAVPRPPL